MSSPRWWTDSPRIARGCRAVALAFGLVAAAGCQQERQHPPLAAACDPATSVCAPNGAFAVGYGANSGSGTPPTDAGTGIVADAGTLTGQVSIFAADDFNALSAYDLPALVEADGTLTARVSTSWNGTDPFQLTDVKVEAANWFSVTPQVAASDAVRTLHVVDTTQFTSLNLALVHATVLDQIFMSLASLTVRNAALANLALFFVSQSNGAPLSGLSVSLPGAGVTAYAAQGGWSDDPIALTDSTGLVLFGNIPADSDPGNSVVVSVDGRATGSFTVLLIGGATSVAQVRVAL